MYLHNNNNNNKKQTNKQTKEEEEEEGTRMIGIRALILVVLKNVILTH